MDVRRLLLVDDEENILSALTRLFRPEGYEIFRANSGMAGLEILRQHEIFVIISDQRMPGMTGVEFLSKVKELYPDTMRIVLSGYTDLNSVTDAINQGAVYKFLTKPWDDELLRKNVRNAFRDFKLKKDNERLEKELNQANAQLAEINNDLQHHVGKDADESLINAKALQMTQEILDCLPIGVIGVGEHGVLGIVNRAAALILGQNTRMEAGASAQDILPAPLINLLAQNPSCDGKVGFVQIDGARLQVWCKRLGWFSGGEGTVMALLPTGDA